MSVKPANHKNRSEAFSTLQAITLVMITGISFGILMSIVSNAFVIGSTGFLILDTILIS